MFPQASGPAASWRGDRATYVGGTVASGGPTASPGVLGAHAGDLAVVIRGPAAGSLSSGSGESWTGGDGCAFKVLTTSDLASGVSASGNPPFALLIYRGPASIAKVGFQYGYVETSATAAGFNKHFRHAGIVASVEKYDPNHDGSAGQPNAPAIFANRINWNNGAHHDRRLFDRLSPANPYYINGTGFQWTTGFYAIGDTCEIFIFELRGG